ncbi:UNVERIFIED_ORG: hypothetical protein ABID57_002158 [Arthrobacter sp. UYEF1]
MALGISPDQHSPRHLLVLTDARGEILWRVGSSEVLRPAGVLRRGRLVRGRDRHQRHQRSAGHRAAGAAVLRRAPGPHPPLWACTAAPITDPATGRLLGVLDVSGPLESLTADTLRMVRCTVSMAEALLGTPDGGRTAGASTPARRPVQRAVARPTAAVESLELLGDQPAAVFRDGSRVTLTLRRAEILALLDSRTQGWSAEELAYELHGDAGIAASIRTEMFRVRSLLGDAVASNPYRLVAGLAGCSDAGRVLRLLRAGRVAEALEAYRDPLLSRSGALAVQLRRDQLDLALGSAVRSSGDADLLIRWLSTDMGSGDFEAVEALGRLVGRGDARYLAFRASSGG